MPSFFALFSALPRVLYCSMVRRTSRCWSLGRFTPRAGFTAITPSETAKDKMPPNKPTVRAAVPAPPSTIERPRSPVLISAAVFPAATSRIKRVISGVVKSRTFLLPSNGKIWRSMRPLSTYSVESFFARPRLPSIIPFSAATR